MHEKRRREGDAMTGEVLSALCLGGLFAALCLLAALDFFTDEETIPSGWRFFGGTILGLIGLAFLVSFGWGIWSAASWMIGGGGR